MLPKSMYETLPYCYFIVGSTLWLASDRPLELIAGILLFFAGAQQWILRSNYRRRDRIKAYLINKNKKFATQQLHHGYYPRGLYEILPFIYIGLGYQLANLLHNPAWLETAALNTGFTLTASICLIIAGYLVLSLRSYHRLHAVKQTKNRE